MDVKTIHKTTLFSLEKLLAKNDLKDIQLMNSERWTDIRRRLEAIRGCQDYFVALRMADELIKDAAKYLKEKGRKAYRRT